MSKTYNNVPMSKSLDEAVKKSDSFWTGPKLIVLNAVVLGISFLVLWLAANQMIGPVFHE